MVCFLNICLFCDFSKAKRSGKGNPTFKKKEKPYPNSLTQAPYGNAEISSNCLTLA